MLGDSVTAVCVFIYRCVNVKQKEWGNVKKVFLLVLLCGCTSSKLVKKDLNEKWEILSSGDEYQQMFLNINKKYVLVKSVYFTGSYSVEGGALYCWSCFVRLIFNFSSFFSLLSCFCLFTWNQRQNFIFYSWAIS